MRWGNEDRVLQKIFPVAGKLAPGNDLCIQCVVQAAVTNHRHAVAYCGVGGGAAFHDGRIEATQWQYEPEPRHLVVSQSVPRNDGALVGGQPDRIGFGDQVPDGEHQSIATNYNAMAYSLGAER